MYTFCSLSLICSEGMYSSRQISLLKNKALLKDSEHQTS